MVWFHSIWKLAVPPKIQCFLWLAILNSIPMKVFLSSRGVHFSPDQLRCVWCGQVEECCSHILLTCPFSSRVWGYVLKWWGISWCSPCSLSSFMLAWDGCPFGGIIYKRWLIVCATSLWSLWLVRNETVFNSKVWDGLQIFFLIKLCSMF